MDGVLDRVVLQLLLVLSGPVRPLLCGDGPGGPALGQAQPARGGSDVRAVLSGQGQEDPHGNIFSPGRCGELAEQDGGGGDIPQASSQRGSDRKSTRLNSSHVAISYAVFCLKKNTKNLQ